MSTIEEQRKKAIYEQIHKTAGTTQEVTIESDDNIAEIIDEVFSESSDNSDIDNYTETFFINKRLENRVSFSLSRDTLDLLKRILYELDGKAFLSAYVDNILKEHISAHRGIINKVIEKNMQRPRMI